MAQDSYAPTRLFTIQQANACLPLVRSIVADMVALARDLHDRRQRLNQLSQSRRSGRDDVYAAEVEQIEEDLERDFERLRGYTEELQELGVECKGAEEGLVDFPCRLDGRLVYLCWKYNEPEVMYWHDIEAGFAGRQPLPVATR